MRTSISYVLSEIEAIRDNVRTSNVAHQTNMTWLFQGEGSELMFISGHILNDISKLSWAPCVVVEAFLVITRRQPTSQCNLSRVVSWCFLPSWCAWICSLSLCNQEVSGNGQTCWKSVVCRNKSISQPSEQKGKHLQLTLFGSVVKKSDGFYMTWMTDYECFFDSHCVLALKL